MKRDDLRPSLAKSVSESFESPTPGTKPHGTKVLQYNEDTIFTDHSGETRSIRGFAVELDDTSERAKQLESDLGEASTRIAASESAVSTLKNVTLPALSEAMTGLEERLEEGDFTDNPTFRDVYAQLTAATSAVQAAQQTADAAVSAASAANQAALQAAGIADSKGRVIYSETEPPVKDRSTSNLWVKPSDASTRVWDGSAWVEVEDKDIKAAAQSAAAANTAAVAAQSTADAAKAQAASAQAAAAKAQATADKGVLDARDAHNAAVAAQTAAETAALDAAKRTRVVYQATAPEPSVDVLWFDTANGNTPKVWDAKLGTSSRRNLVTNPRPRTSADWAGPMITQVVVDNDTAAEAISGTTTPYIFSTRAMGAFAAGDKVTLRAWVQTVTTEGATWLLHCRAHVRTGNVYIPAGIVSVPANTSREVVIVVTLPNDIAAGAGLDFSAVASLVPSTGSKLRVARVMVERGDTSALPYFDGSTSSATSWTGAANASESVYSGPAWVALNDPRVKAAQDSANKAIADAAAAQASADAKATPAQAQAMADAAKAAATTTAAADAKAKADAAQAAATTAAAADATAKAAAAETAAKNAAATDAQQKADAAKADAISASATDAKTKADAARDAAVAAAKSAADAADALIAQNAANDAKAKADAAAKKAADDLAAARGEITSEITASANGKNATRWSTSAASASVPGVVAGDTWMQVDNLATRNVKGQWTWDGSAWKAVLIRSEVIAALDVAKLTAGTANIATAVVDKLFANIFTAKKIQAGQINAESVAAAVGTFVKVDVGQLTATSGSISALVAQKIAAATASIQEAYIQNLRTDGAEIDLAVIGDLAANLITSGMFRTGEEGQRLEMTSNGLIMWLVDPDGEEYQAVRIGPTGAQLITVGDVTIAPKVSATDTTPEIPASVTAPHGIFKTLQISGQSAADFVTSRVWESAPRMVALGGAGMAPGGVIGLSAGVETGIFDVPVSNIQPDHWYRAELELLTYPRGGSVAELYASLRHSPISQGVMTNSPAVAGRRLGPLSNTQWDHARTTFWFKGSQLSLVGQGGTARLLLTITSSARIDVTGDTTLAVYTEGRGLPFSSTLNRGGAPEVGSTTSTAAPVSSSVQPYTKVYAATGSTTYYSSNNQVDTYSNGDVVQGSYDGTPLRRRHGLWTFPDMVSDLAGATIKSVEIQATCTHTGSSGSKEAHFYTHPGSNSAGANVMNAYFSKDQSRWLPLPSQHWNLFKDGTAKGLMVYTASNSTAEYMRFAPGSGSAQIRISYEK